MVWLLYPWGLGPLSFITPVPNFLWFLSSCPLSSWGCFHWSVSMSDLLVASSLCSTHRQPTSLPRKMQDSSPLRSCLTQVIAQGNSLNLETNQLGFFRILVIPNHLVTPIHLVTLKSDLGFIREFSTHESSHMGFPGDSDVKNPPTVQETWVGSLDWERSPGEGNAYPL